MHGYGVLAQPEDVGDDVLGLAGMLRAALDVELAALVEVGQRRVSLEVEVLLAEVLVVTFEDVRRPGQRRLDVPATRDPGRALEDPASIASATVISDGSGS